ncbi:MAG: flagellar assembly protein FliH [Deltaproteobacteria bacterium]|nr:flagellar assembly protein FliH [Deltaproteobacteria bacterium]
MSLFKETPEQVEEFLFPGFDTGEERELITEFCFQPLAYQEPGMEPTPEMIEAAQGIVGEARKRAQHIERQAYEEGFEQGQKDGREVGERSLDQQVQQFRDLVQALDREKEELYHRREKELLDLVLLISRKVVVRELKLQPEAIQEIVAAGFKILADTENIKLRINPLDHEILQWAPQESWPPGVELVPDGTISPGGFMMETACGDIDGTVKNRWAVVAQMVQKALQVEDEQPEAD